MVDGHIYWSEFETEDESSGSIWRVSLSSE